MPDQDQADHLLDLARTQGILHARELEAAGIPRIYLRRLCDRGSMRQLGRGLYSLAGPPISAQHALALAAATVPKGVVCLFSALHFYGISRTAPSDVWMAVSPTQTVQQVEQPPIRFIRMSGRGFTHGRIVHVLLGVDVAMTTLAKTVADCFAFPDLVEPELAIETLRRSIAQRKATIAEIWNEAGHCRVEQVIRPHLEAAA